jgi:hypothetical protein
VVLAWAMGSETKVVMVILVLVGGGMTQRT